MSGDRLAGGWMRGARLVAGTVHRPVHENSAFVHRLLRWLENEGFTGAPHLVGVEGGEEILTFIDGVVPVETSPTGVPGWIWQDGAVASAFRLVRRFHDLTARCPLREGQEVVCHGDLSPWNSVYRDGSAVAFIDWDGAAPGPRSRDLGYALWRYLRLGFPDGPDPEEAGRRARRACDAYGLEDRSGVVDAIAGEQQRQRRWFTDRDRAGDPHVRRVIEAGALEYVDGARKWLELHGDELHTALS